MCALTLLKYEFLVENILSKINKKKKKTEFNKVLKDHNGNRQQIHLSETCGRQICMV